MIRVIFIAIVIATLVLSIAAVKHFTSPKTVDRSKAAMVSPKPSDEVVASPQASSVTDRLTNLEKVVNSMEDKFATSTVGTTKKTTTSLATKDANSNLFDTVTDLQKRVTKLEQGSTPTTTTTAKAPQYIPLGISGASTSTDWKTLDNIEVTVDPADYPGYKNMTLEVSLRVYQGNGMAFARLFNTTDGTAVLGSQASTASENYNWVVSQTFTLSSGSKHYKMQLKTTTGYEAGVQSARIKVVF